MNLKIKNLNTNKTIIIAEGCDNHFGSLDNAKKMVLQAKLAGADVIKFQHHIPDAEMLPKVPKSKNFKISLYKFLKKYSLKLKDHEEILKFCIKKKIKYLCTPFSLRAAHELNELGVDWYKIGSGEFTDLPFIKKVIGFGKPVILSTGMSSQKEIFEVYKFILKYKKNSIVLMNCTSEYPPKIKDLNLGFIKKMIKNFPKTIIGHSDHTNNIYTSIAAVSLGAKMIEKHVYLNGKNFGPDRDVSINFKQLKSLVTAIRQVEEASGENKEVYSNEKSIQMWARRSLYATQNIKKGQKFSVKNIWSIRPGTGIPSKHMDKIIGKTASQDIKSNTLLKISQIKFKKNEKIYN